MPPTRSVRRRSSASSFTAPGRKSMFSHASGFTIDGGTFNISGSQPLDPPTLPNRPWRYVKHLETRVAKLEDLINLSIENNSNDQPAYGDETGAPDLVRESKDAMDHSGSMPADSSQGTNNSRGRCRAQGLGGFHSYLPTPSVSIIPDRAGELPHSPRWTLADVGFKQRSRQQFVTPAIPALQRDRRPKTPWSVLTAPALRISRSAQSSRKQPLSVQPRRMLLPLLVYP
ncbi:hypothetical protein DFH09DRAFT_1453141 [Mycena vulgaris]|nr:hypothetical protein DFH09DRAFT_1453141 [Mycena vulgaris]